MAITFNQPIKDWYFDTTSEWTLDYPPLFAAFELFLATIAHFLNVKDALQLSKIPIRTESVIFYQKITVIVSDCLYYYAVYKLCHSLQVAQTSEDATTTKVSTNEDKRNEKSTTNNNNGKKKSVQVRVSPTQSKCSLGQNLRESIYRPDACSCMAILFLVQPGLLLVDHIHFQYNGFLSGVLLLSMAHVIDGRMVEASFWFAILLNLKHIYLYCAPAFGMYLLVSYCLEKVPDRNRLWTFITRFGRLGSVVALIFIMTYLLFCDQVTLKQIVSRLFPFKRGLTHAYWAPNFWSLYNLADKILATVFRDSLKVNFDLETIKKTRTMIKPTSGRVGEFEHQYLPTIKPFTTFVLVATFVVPVVVKFLLSPRKRAPRLFMKGLTLATFISFMFGWHVHEKAIILVLLPMIPLNFTDPQLREAFLRLTLAGTYSLFPLIYQPAEYVTKLTLLVAYYYYARSHNPILDQSKRNQKSIEQRQQSSEHKLERLWLKFYHIMDTAYILVIIFNEIYFSLVFGRYNYAWNPIAKLNRYEFLPLMMTSTLSALGIGVSFIEIYYDFIFRSNGSIGLR
jgi:alpha-1,3-glucosyltransferase